MGRDVVLDRPLVRTLWIAGVIAATYLAAPAARADVMNDCYSGEYHRQISGCTALIDDPSVGAIEKSHAYSTRALGHSMRSLYGDAIKDYDAALILTPNAPIALNNRAWAYFRWGKAAMGQADVERALELAADMDAAYDTRAHIRQALGDPAAAFEDYLMAMDFGGERMVLMYQCGLKDHGLYSGPRDGIQNEALKVALQLCSQDAKCDPLPADEHCRPASS